MSRSGIAVLGFVFGLLPACVPGPLEGGRYECRLDGGADQCPGSWRCGLEGYCHKLGDTRTKWRCEDDTHCENGWQCGLNAARDEGECHDPEKTDSYACREDKHCTLGWHCGADGRCYDRTVQADHVCRFGAGDCADGWRCGLSGRCQSQDAGAPYVCGTDAGLSDSWCERGWRCAPEGRCIDPEGDALLKAAPAAIAGVTKINPLRDFLPIEKFAVSQRFEVQPGAGFQTVVTLQKGRLTARLTSSLDSTDITYDLGPWGANRTFAAQGSRGQYEGFTIVKDETPRVFITYGDAGLAVRVVELQPDGSLDGGEIELLFPGTRLNVGSAHGPLEPRTLAFSEKTQGFTRFFGGSTLVLDHYLEDYSGELFSDVPGNKLLDVVDVRALEVMDCLFAVDHRGLWAEQRAFNSRDSGISSYLFEPVSIAPFTNDHCTPPTANTQRLTSLAPRGREWLGYSSTALDGGQAGVGVMDLRPLWTRNERDAFCSSRNYYPCAVDGRIPVEMSFGPCLACPGGRLIDFAIVDGAGTPNIEVICGLEDAGTQGFFTVSKRHGTLLCDRRLTNGEGGLFAGPQLVKAEQRTPGLVTWTSKEGYMWLGSSTYSAIPQVFDRAATTVARRGTELSAFTPDLAGVPAPGVGLTTTLAANAVSGVWREPEWIVTQDRQILTLAGAQSVADVRQVGIVGTMVTPFEAPYAAEKTRSGSAEVVVVSAGSSVFSAETSGSYIQLGLKVVSPSQIQSLAFPEQAPAGLYLQGYVVTPNGVLKLQAETSARWAFSEVALPSLLAPLEVWFEGNRGRVGFADGTVYSLPSRVQIAPPLPDKTVVDYAQACGQQLALSLGGLYRLEPAAGQALGVWSPLPLPAGFAPGGLARGRLHGLGADVYVFARTGEALRLTFATCPAP